MRPNALSGTNIHFYSTTVDNGWLIAPLYSLTTNGLAKSEALITINTTTNNIFLKMLQDLNQCQIVSQQNRQQKLLSDVK